MLIKKTLSTQHKNKKLLDLHEHLKLKPQTNTKIIKQQKHLRSMLEGNKTPYTQGFASLLKKLKGHFRSDLDIIVDYKPNLKIQVKNIPFYHIETNTIYLYDLGATLNSKHIYKTPHLEKLKTLLLENKNDTVKIDEVKIIQTTKLKKP